jgi:hypothetical protein
MAREVDQDVGILVRVQGRLIIAHLQVLILPWREEATSQQLPYEQLNPDTIAKVTKLDIGIKEGQAIWSHGQHPTLEWVAWVYSVLVRQYQSNFRIDDPICLDELADQQCINHMPVAEQYWLELTITAQFEVCCDDEACTKGEVPRRKASTSNRAPTLHPAGSRGRGVTQSDSFVEQMFVTGGIRSHGWIWFRLDGRTTRRPQQRGADPSSFMLTVRDTQS